MNKETFNFDKNNGIFIYGCSDIGKDKALKLSNKGYPVKGFIDRNAKSINNYENLPVYAPENLSTIYAEEDIIVVALNNGMEHEKVADLLFSYGINRVLYLPMHVFFSYDNRRLLRYFYRLFSRNDFENIKNVPVYKKSYEDNIKVINMDNKYIVFWCPIVYIFKCNSDGSHINLKDFEPYLNLYEWIKNENSDVSLYIDFIDNYRQKTSERIKYLLKDRREMVKIFEDALRYDTLFFTDAPCQLFWNEKNKCFLIGDGSHRSYFLMSKGYDRVPAITSLEDFESFKMQITPPLPLRRFLAILYRCINKAFVSITLCLIYVRGLSWKSTVHLTSIKNQAYLYMVVVILVNQLLKIC